MSTSKFEISKYLQMLIVEESDQPDSGPIRVCLGVESIQAKTIQQLTIVGDISTQATLGFSLCLF